MEGAVLDDEDAEDDCCAPELAVAFATHPLLPETIRLILVSGDDPHAVAAEGFVDAENAFAEDLEGDWERATRRPAAAGPGDSLWRTINDALAQSDRRDGTNVWGCVAFLARTSLSLSRFHDHS